MARIVLLMKIDDLFSSVIQERLVSDASFAFFIHEWSCYNENFLLLIRFFHLLVFSKFATSVLSLKNFEGVSSHSFLFLIFQKHTVRYCRLFKDSKLLRGAFVFSLAPSFFLSSVSRLQDEVLLCSSSRPRVSRSRPLPNPELSAREASKEAETRTIWKFGS